LRSLVGPVASGAGGDLHLSLDFPLPGTLRVGAGTALFLCGWCFAEAARIRSVSFVVDGEVQPAMAQAMPRSDVMEAVKAEEPGRSYRSGFWGIARITARESGGECELLLQARLEDGNEVVAELGRIEITDAERPVDAGPLEIGDGRSVAICMATHEPPMDLFRRQLGSIRAQSHRNWICVISDDCSSPERFEAMREALEGDPRFVLSRASGRLGFYANFERALTLAPADVDYVAMADQDDLWHPDKLATLVAAIGTAKLIYSDARIVDRAGELVSDTYWQVRRNNHSSLFSLLVANSVTGAASLFPRRLLDSALPFPPGQFAHFHDHWIALTALALGDIAFVERPLYDYTQHGGAVLGHAEANRVTALADRFRSLRRPLRERVGRWRFTYFVDACRLIQFATVLQMRCGNHMSAPKRRALEYFLRADRSSLALGRFVARAGRELVGPPETLGAELGLFFGFSWRHLLVASTTGLKRPRRRLRIDARPPTNLVQKPGRRDPEIASVGAIAAKVAPLELAVHEDAPKRINLLIPTIDLAHFFGGYIGKLNLARRLAERGARVRVVTVDPVGPLPRSWQATVESYSGLAGLFETVEVEFGRESPGLEVSRSDSFIATTWWTAHIAHSALRSLGRRRFLYLIQEYEPFTFPMGTLAALANESYRFPHSALFSTELLRDYFRRHELGVYSDGADAGDAISVAFENAITAVRPPAAIELAARDRRKLLFYARPEPHAARNMFELGALALSRAVGQGVLGGDWELYGIGTVEGGRRMALGSGAVLELLPRCEQSAYAELLRAHDVGLALMYTPHPSLVPIEMASAGMLAVTNSFENKTPEAMAAISSNLITAEPSVDGVVAGLTEAVVGVDRFESRVRGGEVSWSRDWNQSFDDALMERLEALLNGGAA
jgi:glycosyltransferase involved in cell wall biosynthesis